jgi:hypothetical protein
MNTPTEIERLKEKLALLTAYVQHAKRVVDLDETVSSQFVGKALDALRLGIRDISRLSNRINKLTVAEPTKHDKPSK